MKSGANLPLRRWLYLALLGATILLGLMVRTRHFPAPHWFTKPAGDVLYATAAFWGWRLVLPSRFTRRALVATGLSCAAIEFLKLLPSPELAALRASSLGRLVFGVGFHWENLFYYVAGALLALGVERLLAIHSSPSK